MKSAQKLVSLFVFVFGFVFVSHAEAAQLLNAKLTLGDTRPQTSSTHTFTFRAPTNATLKAINIQYCKSPSGTCDDPDQMAVDGTHGTLNTGGLVGITDGNWSLNTGVKNVPKIQHTGAGQTLVANTDITIPIQSVSNPAIADCNPVSNNSAGTCYAIIKTCTELTCAGSEVKDEGIVSFTIVAEITISARVDPSFTFVVESVAANTVHGGITTSVASDFNQLPFSNLTVGTPKYVAHGLRVTTNTQNGYAVTMRMAQQMRGNYTDNNIDPFIAPWSAPTSWTEPTGTNPNDNTGWIGANTTDTDVANWNPMTERFGAANTANTVMQGAASDSGAAVVYVTYAIEANVFQPADTYSGIVQYNAVPTY